MRPSVSQMSVVRPMGMATAQSRVGGQAEMAAVPSAESEDEYGEELGGGGDEQVEVAERLGEEDGQQQRGEGELKRPLAHRCLAASGWR